MTDDEFQNWLRDEVANERMQQAQMDDLLKQKFLFDGAFGSPNSPLRTEFTFQIVGYVADKRIVANEIHVLIDTAKREFPGRMIYFEPIEFDLF